MSRFVDPKKGGDKPPKKAVCSICGEEFPSKSRLFAHLPSHGWEPDHAEGAVVKTALVVGWLRPAVGLMTSDDFVGRTLIAAVDKVDGVYEQRAAFSAAQCGTTSSMATHNRAEGDHSSAGDVWMLQLAHLPEYTPAAALAWVAAINTTLQAMGGGAAAICVLDRITLPLKDFDPESACTMRQYDALFPVDMLVPPATPEGDALIAEMHNVVNGWKAAKGESATDLDKYDTPKKLSWKPRRQVLAKKFIDDVRARQFFGAMKQIMKRLCGSQSQGRRSWHNFTTLRACPADNAARKRMGRFFHLGVVEMGGRAFSKFRITGESLMRGQVRCMLGLMLAIARGIMPPSAVDDAMSDNVLDVPPVPGWLFYIQEVKFERWETKFRQVLDPRRRDRLSKMEVSQSLVEGCGEGVENTESTEVRRARGTETALKLERAEDVVFEYEDRVSHHIAMLHCDEGSGGGRAWLASFEEECRGVWARYTQERTMVARNFGRGPTNFDDDECDCAAAMPPPPPEYLDVLRLLREADASGLWPETTEARKRVIDEAEMGGNEEGGSFSVGAMPVGMTDPRGNSLFPELLRAAFRLEQVIAPGRKPSATIAVNRHAAFIPHRDTGAGAGQTISCIVALGNFFGGEIVVEGEAHDIRYKPLEFNGWKQRHWTLPFKGERYSLVYFTPLGVEDSRLFWNQEARSHVEGQPPTVSVNQ